MEALNDEWQEDMNALCTVEKAEACTATSRSLLEK